MCECGLRAFFRVRPHSYSLSPQSHVRLIFTANDARGCPGILQVNYTRHHSSVSLVCTPIRWTHDWLAARSKRDELANKTGWSWSRTPGGLSIKPLRVFRGLQNHQWEHQRLFRTRTSTHQRWVVSPPCWFRTGWWDGTKPRTVLHRAPTWCWKPGLCFWRTRCSSVPCTSRRQLPPGTLAASSLCEWVEGRSRPSCSEQKCVFRTSKESVSDGVSLSSDDAQRLFNAVKELLQIPSDEQDPQTADGDGYRMALHSSNDAPACGIRHRCNTLLLQAQLQLVCCFYQGTWWHSMTVLCSDPVTHEAHSLTHSLIHSFTHPFSINSTPLDSHERQRDACAAWQHGVDSFCMLVSCKPVSACLSPSLTVWTGRCRAAAPG